MHLAYLKDTNHLKIALSSKMRKKVWVKGEVVVADSLQPHRL